VNAGEDGSPRGTRRRTRLAVVCAALGVLFGSGLWRATGGADDHTDRDAAVLIEQSRVRSDALGGMDARESAPQPLRAPADALDSIDWSTVRYPMSCPGHRTRVVRSEFADLNRDGAREAAVLVRCATGDDRAPTGLYVYTSGPGPRLLATLLRPSAALVATRVRATASGIKASGFRHSSASVPRCCADETFEAAWRWNGAGFTRVG
jgi:hypothetical protein